MQSGNNKTSLEDLRATIVLELIHWHHCNIATNRSTGSQPHQRQATTTTSKGND